MELLTAALLTARHGFPTRAGGVSTGAFASLNTSYAVGDEASHVDENLARLAASAGVAPGQLATVTQVHGDRVLRAEAGGVQGEADAVWTKAAGVVVGVRTADCLPILVEDVAGGRVAAVHAGWRGVIAEIVLRAAEALEADGARREDLRFALGPAIQRCCFEVDGDLPARFAAAFGDEVVVTVAGKPRRHLDLSLAVRRGLERAGVAAGQVSVRPECTACDARFFSHRRDQGRTGRQLSFIACGAAGL